MNSPLLDVAIGLVFIFLLYSLLVTSIHEAIATLFGMRARMLKKAIVIGMLSDTMGSVSEVVKKWLTNFLKKISNLFKREYRYVFESKKGDGQKQKIGDKFYGHPLIKNYGSGLCFSLPSYIPTSNFSTVLIDILKEDFLSKSKVIAQYKFDQNPSKTETPDDIEQKLKNSADALKIKELLDYYNHQYDENKVADNKSNIIDNKERVIDSDTLQILRMLLDNSNYDIEKFVQKLETWFDDFMKRVSGWYKRQSQIIIFVIAILTAVIFNVDTIEISVKLSTDKDARDKLVQLAVESADRYKDDPRVKKINGTTIPDTTAKNDSIFKLYQANLDSAKRLINHDIRKANSIMAIGWGDFGKKRDSAKVLRAFLQEKDAVLHMQKLQTSKKAKYRKSLVDSLYNKHWIKYKVGYVLKETTRGRKFLGFLLTAFAISLGAPFWFDLLNKLIRLRGAGKKEEGAGNTEPGTSSSSGKSTTISEPVG